MEYKERWQRRQVHPKGVGRDRSSEHAREAWRNGRGVKVVYKGHAGVGDGVLNLHTVPRFLAPSTAPQPFYILASV